MSKVVERETEFQTRYKVLVLRNDNATGPHQRVIAICLEQNLTGRGKDMDEALDDLGKNLFLALTDEWVDLRPAYAPDPDPSLLEVYKSDSHQTPDGYLVLRRLTVSLKFSIKIMREKGVRRIPKIVYEESLA